MKMIGNEVYIQRGETWSLDFAVTNDKGHPYVVLKNWNNPYLAITVAAALYEQRGDFRETYWLDLSRRYIEGSDGGMSLVDMKKFTSAEVLFLPNGFDVQDALIYYGVNSDGKIVLDKTSDFDVTNFLFYSDPFSDGNYVYKYVSNYTTQTAKEKYQTIDADGNVVINERTITHVATQAWADYDFRIVKQFTTKDWMEQGYLFDIKVLAGESVQEHLKAILDMQQNVTVKDFDLWTNEDWESYIASIEDEDVRAEMLELYEEGAPLMPTYDTKSLLLDPTPIYVSVNIQGGVR